MWEVRAISESEADLFRLRLARGFGVDPDDDEESRDRFVELFEIDRTFAVFEEDDIIGTGGAFSFGLSLPGGHIGAMAGTTIITVQPTHRRRRVLTAMMDYHLADAAARGEPLAGLWASESTIYGRFGYGVATSRHEMKMDTSAVEMARPDSRGTVRLVDGERADPVLREVYEAVRPGTTGMLTRSDAWWRLRIFRDSESARGGKSSKRYAVYVEDGKPLGYAIYRQKEKWEDFPEGEVHVVEVITADPSAHRGLWGFLTNIDLFPNLECWNLPIDDPLPFHVVDSRRIERKLSDSLWLRLLDIPAALSLRSYEHDGSLTIGVEDPFHPHNSGLYRLEVEAGSGVCERAGAVEPDVEVGVDVLGHLYLGGGDAHAMSHAGRVRGSAEAVTALHRLFRTDRAPWCQEVF